MEILALPKTLEKNMSPYEPGKALKCMLLLKFIIIYIEAILLTSLLLELSYFWWFLELLHSITLAKTTVTITWSEMENMMNIGRNLIKMGLFQSPWKDCWSECFLQILKSGQISMSLKTNNGCSDQHLIRNSFKNISLLVTISSIKKIKSIEK